MEELSKNEQGGEIKQFHNSLAVELRCLKSAKLPSSSILFNNYCLDCC